MMFVFDYKSGNCGFSIQLHAKYGYVNFRTSFLCDHMTGTSAVQQKNRSGLAACREKIDSVIVHFQYVSALQE